MVAQEGTRIDYGSGENYPPIRRYEWRKRTSDIEKVGKVFVSLASAFEYTSGYHLHGHLPMTDYPEQTFRPDISLSAQTSLEPGSTLGSFLLVSNLGEGRMGRVFVAEDTRLTRKVAIKVMKPDAAKEERARKMFLREARSAAIIGNDRIVTIYEVNEAAGVPYIAMELLAGEPLDKFLARTPRPRQPVAIAIALQVAEGLHAAHTHELNLIHRDIKPANIWLRSMPARKGFDVRLLDFGLSRAAAGDSLSIDNDGKVVGTPLYMAPEQWDGKGVDHQSDLFSLGVILYQMLTGRPPFQGESSREVMYQICMPSVVPMPPATLNPAISADLSMFVLRMIAKDKTDRVQTAAEVMQVLAKLRKALFISTTVPELRLAVTRPPEFNDTASLHDTRGGTATAPAVPHSLPSRGRVGVLAAGVLLQATFIAAMAIMGGGKATTEATRPPLIDCTGPNGATADEVGLAQQKWADYLGVPIECRVDLGDGVGMDFVLLPPGQFLMGTSALESQALAERFPDLPADFFKNERPQHRVVITRPMYVGKTEVTRAQLGRHRMVNNLGGEIVPWLTSDSHPAVNISWQGAKAFADWVSKRSLPVGFRSARLPREAEWEYACRAGTQSCYPNGSNDPETLAVIANVADASAKNENPDWVQVINADDGFAYTAPVASMRANQFGLHDMIGNVWEWCEDGYEVEAYKRHGPSDPCVKSRSGLYVSRGGSWNAFPWHTRAAFRNANNATDQHYNKGCRLVLPQDSD